MPSLTNLETGEAVKLTRVEALLDTLVAVQLDLKAAFGDKFSTPLIVQHLRAVADACNMLRSATAELRDIIHHVGGSTRPDRVSALGTGRVVLASVLDQSQEVKAKVEACAEELNSTNSAVKEMIAEGVTTLSAPNSLESSEKVEAKVQECAAELHEVNETLAKGIDDLKHSEDALTKSQKALGESEAALADSKHQEQKARIRALHDSTTGLPNRDLFRDRLTHGISLADRHRWTLAVMFLDLDGFKTVNDNHGHTVGDGVLKEVAQRLMQNCRDEDTVCRNGGDEFLYLFINPQGSKNIEYIAYKIIKSIAQPIAIGDLRIVINASIGIAIYPDDGKGEKDLISNADAAMYRAKARTCRYAFFDGSETATTPVSSRAAKRRH